MKRTRNILSLLTVIVLCFFVQVANAQVKMPAVFGDHMVLQRELNTPVWGTAAPKEAVTVKIAGQVKETQADEQGKWLVRLDPLPAGGPFTLVVSTAKNKIVFQDVLFGDVWICSGQSNMSFNVKRAKNSDKEIAEAKFPNIRLLGIRATSKALPQTDVPVTPWCQCSPTTVPGFSAVGFFFGRKLHQELNIPIGLINDSWGGATCEAFVETGVLAAHPDLAPVVEPKRIEKGKDQYKAGYLYNGMILPIQPYGIKGAIWYQGESNAGRAAQHEIMFPIMIANWRETWGQGDFPFYFVQLANYKKVLATPEPSSWAELRESQSKALACRKTGEAIIIDIGEATDIHPTNKQDVGLRLAAIALANDYGKDVPYSGPRLREMKVRGNRAILAFDCVGAGLVAKNAKPEEGVKGFAVAGKDKKFYWGKAKIEGDTIVVTAPEVAVPVAVRYAWADNPVCNLYNKEGFPASPFRTDAWPRITQSAR